MAASDGGSVTASDGGSVAASDGGSVATSDDAEDSQAIGVPNFPLVTSTPVTLRANQISERSATARQETITSLVRLAVVVVSAVVFIVATTMTTTVVLVFGSRGPRGSMQVCWRGKASDERRG